MAIDRYRVSRSQSGFGSDAIAVGRQSLSNEVEEKTTVKRIPIVFLFCFVLFFFFGGSVSFRSAIFFLFRSFWFSRRVRFLFHFSLSLSLSLSLSPRANFYFYSPVIHWQRLGPRSNRRKFTISRKRNNLKTLVKLIITFFFNCYRTSSSPVKTQWWLENFK